MDKLLETASALERLASLAQETRLETFRLLMRSAPNGLHAGEIARRLGVVQNTMSAHLNVLTRSGLVSARREGRAISYRADPGAVRQLLVFLMEDCCQGAPEVCAPLLALTACSRGGGENER